MNAGNAKANLLKAEGSLLMSAGAPSAAPMYMTPRTRGMMNAATILFSWLEGVLMNALKERWIRGENCLKNGV